MKLRTICTILTLLPAFCGVLHLKAGSVKLVDTIPFGTSAKKKNVASFLLGKKKKKTINPFAICLLSGERLCITDVVNGAVLILRKDGKKLKTIRRVKGVNLVAPVHVCADAKGDIYVCDSGLRAVLQWDARLKFKKVFFTRAGTRITGMVFADGVFYAVDTPNHRILRIDATGKIISSFGTRGTQEGQFNYPTHITADDENLYITDAMNFRVQIFDHSGKFIKTFGSSGRGGGNFSKPKGIAVDGKKRIYVADAMFDNVQIFDFSGRFLYYFGGRGHEPGEFWMPTGILCTGNKIWVTDTYNHRLQQFQLQEE
ncbi:MAG: 6-bladed beta-propeller [bacterium]|nr:6-bladed beta-propeller [bacterium]